MHILVEGLHGIGDGTDKGDLGLFPVPLGECLNRCKIFRLMNAA